VWLALALAASTSTALGTVLTKDLVNRLPARQVIAPLFLINAALATPLFAIPSLGGGSTWHLLDPTVLALHACSVLLMVVASSAFFRLIDRGSPSAVSIGTALSPVVTLLATPLLLAVAIPWGLAGGALTLVAGVLIALRGQFAGIRAPAAVGLLTSYAVCQGVLIVLAAALFVRGVSLPEVYVSRTALAGLVFLGLAWPRAVHLRDLPVLIRRAGLITLGFLLALSAVRISSPVAVQSTLAVTPLLVITIESIWLRRWPSRRIVLAGLVCCGGVFLLLRSGSLSLG